MNNSSGAVFISNVDDYLAPSQACVNPLYNNSTSNDANEETKKEATPATADIVVPRQRRRRPRVTPSEGGGPVIPKTTPAKDPIKASMADCLACSGCVTTAETVLLEQQHSLTALKAAIQTTNDQILVATISPAVWADMLRHLQIPSSQAQLWQQKLTTSLQEILQVSYELDGNIPLQWTLLESGEEFCRAYQRKHTPSSPQPATTINGTAQNDTLARIQELEETNTPSVALNSQETNYMLPNGSTQTIPTTATLATPMKLPILTSTCPALVCLAEKSTHGAVRHLSKTKSPMSLAGAWWRGHQQQQQQQRYFHLALMPCHDKKLEASRKDFLRGQQQDVDLVLTTQEWFQMLVEYCHNRAGTTTLQDSSNEESLALVKAYLDSLTPAPRVQSLMQSGPITTNGSKVTLLMAPERSETANGDDMELDDNKAVDMDIEMEAAAPTSFFALGSGGVAEFVFRYAAWRLFDTSISHVEWKPVETASNNNNKPNRVVSARMKRAAAKNRDYYQATLYQHTTGATSTYSCSPGGIPVLRFGIAYGLQTVQRILEPFQTNENRNGAVAETYPFDFVEAMACPSGCLNGGGQLRVADRETPTETRQRVALTRDLFGSSNVPPVASSQSLVDEAIPKSERQTRFHVVPPLQHSFGAAAGVAVKDTQW